jgi:DNA-binding ferritin-like protein
MKLSSNVKFLIEKQVQFRILHWQTKGYARHKAFGRIYSALDDLIDTYVETAMGKQGRFMLMEEDKTISLTNLKELDIVSFLQEIKTYLIDLTNELDTSKDTDLLNIRDEMLGEVNKLAYLLTLE